MTDITTAAPNGYTSDTEQLTGRLIVVEGIDGSGKSTQLDLLHKWLRSEGYATVFTEWNSSPIVRGTTRRGKRRKLLTPMSFSLIHAADYASRMHAQIRPALQAGVIVLADRYVYTAFARDAARGVNPQWLRDLYSFAVPPNLAVYFNVPLEESIARITLGRDELKYYEAGLDMGFADEPKESFRVFQSRILEEYDALCSEFAIKRIDATLPLTEQQAQFREVVREQLDGVPRGPRNEITDLLQKTGLSGHYLAGSALRR